MSETSCIAVLNCGSSSIKFAVFDAAADASWRQPLWNGKVQGIGSSAPDFGETGVPPLSIVLDMAHPYHDALVLIRERLVARLDGRRIVAVAHRVVHGGGRYSEPVRVDAQVLADLQTYVPLAPLHQPFALEAIEILLRELPTLPQVACFDTGFHDTIPDVEKVLPLPYDAWPADIVYGALRWWLTARVFEVLGQEEERRASLHAARRWVQACADAMAPELRRAFIERQPVNADLMRWSLR